MKWLDNKILAAVELYMKLKGEEIDQKLSDLKKESILYAAALKRLDDKLERGFIQNTESFRKEMFGLRYELQEESSMNYRRLNLKIDERENEMRDDCEMAVTGMTKILDKRLETLGEKKGVVVDLLKKIAKLEAVHVDG